METNINLSKTLRSISHIDRVNKDLTHFIGYWADPNDN